VQRIEEVVLKTSIFPTTSLSRMLFTIMSTLNRSLFIAQIITTHIFLIVFYRHEIALLMYAPFIFLMMIVSIVILTTIVFLKSRGSIHRVAMVALGILFFMIGAPIGVVAFHFTSILSGVPIVSWAVAGILAMHHAQYGSVIFYASLHVVIIAGSLFIGRKIV
jgi:hypothetical protein